jgi:hypothetical protein
MGSFFVCLAACCIAQQAGQRDAPPVGGLGGLVFINVRRLRFSSVSGVPFTVTLGLPGLRLFMLKRMIADLMLPEFFWKF